MKSTDVNVLRQRRAAEIESSFPPIARQDGYIDLDVSTIEQARSKLFTLRQAPTLYCYFRQPVYPHTHLVARFEGDALIACMTVKQILFALNKEQEVGLIYVLDASGKPSGMRTPDGLQHLTNLLQAPLEIGWLPPWTDNATPSHVEILQPQRVTTAQQ